jgi:hypothetical protein
VLGLDRDCYLSIIKFLDSSILRKVWVNLKFFFLISIWVFCSTLALVKNHTHEWNTFTLWSIDWKVLLLFIAIILFRLFPSIVQINNSQSTWKVAIGRTKYHISMWLSWKHKVNYIKRGNIRWNLRSVCFVLVTLTFEVIIIILFVFIFL